MTAVVSPSQDFQQRRRRSIHAEDELFKSLQGLQELNNSERQQRRNNSIDAAGRGQQGTTTASPRNPNHRMKRRSSIGGNRGQQTANPSPAGNHRMKRRSSIGGNRGGSDSSSAERRYVDTSKAAASPRRQRRNSISNGATPMRSNSSDQRNLRNDSPVGAQLFNSVGMKPQPVDVEDRQSCGGTNTRRMRRRGSTGMPLATRPSIIPDSLTPQTMRGVSPAEAHQAINAVGIETQPPSLEKQSCSGASRIMRRRGSIGRAPDMGPVINPDIMSPETMRTISTVAAQFNNGAGIEVQPPTLERHPSGGTPSRMRRRGSIGRVPDVNRPKAQPPSLERHSSCGTPRRMRRRGSIGSAAPPMNPAINPDIMSPETMRAISTVAAQFNNSVGIETQPPSLERHSSGGTPRRMRRRGSIGSAAAHMNQEPQPPNLERQSSGETPRRMRRRGSTGMAPEFNSAIMSTPKTIRHLARLEAPSNNDVNIRPQPLVDIEDRQSSGGTPRRMCRRGSTGMAPVGMNPVVIPDIISPLIIPKGFTDGRRLNQANDPWITPKKDGRRSSDQRNLRNVTPTGVQLINELGVGPHPPGLEDRHQCSGGTRMRRRGSTGGMAPEVNPIIIPKTLTARRSSHTNDLKTPQDEGRTKPVATAGGPLVFRSFNRSSAFMSTTSFDSIDWGVEKSDRTDSTEPISDGSVTAQSDRAENNANLLQNLMEQLKDPVEMERRRVKRERVSSQKKAHHCTTEALEHDKVTEKASSLNFKTFLTRSKRGYGHQANLDGLSCKKLV